MEAVVGEAEPTGGGELSVKSPSELTPHHAVRDHERDAALKHAQRLSDSGLLQMRRLKTSTQRVIKTCA